MDENKLNEFLHRFVGDLGATIAAGSVVVGHRLGLYEALAAAPATADDLARRTECDPRYVAEWLRGQAAGGYVTYDAQGDIYSLTEEQAFVLADPDGAVYAPGAFVLALGSLQAGRPDHRGVPHGCRHRLARARRRACSSAASSSSGPGYLRQPGAGVAAGAGRRRGQAARRRQGRRRRLRARSLDDPARRGVPAVHG